MSNVEKGNIGKICEEKKDIDQENIGGGLLLPMSETGDPDDPDDLEQAEFEESFPWFQIIVFRLCFINLL